MNQSKKVWNVELAATALMLAAFPGAAMASAAPWETPMQTVVGYLTGTTGTLIATIGICVAGVLFMIGKISWEWLAGVVFGMAIVFGAPSIVSALHP